MKKRKLVFLQPSPNYCRMNATAGYKGLVGRVCRTDPNSPNQETKMKKCINMCKQCGLYVRRKTIDVVTSCNCK